MAKIITLTGRVITAEQYLAEAEAQRHSAEPVEAEDECTTWYVNYRGGEGNETVDECDSYMEAHALRYEYEMSDPDGHYTVSNMPCPGWEES